MRTIRQTALIRGATPHDIFETLMDAKRHSTLVGGQRVKVSRRPGGAFSVGHDLEGRTLRVAKDGRIVQSWRANNWPKGLYSKATFALAKTPGGTRITFTQTGVPSAFYGEIASGWRTYYWTPLRKQFASRRSGEAA
ncbi:MAG TPA: SRPBCC domain-containing protein [Candidatus Limnocylindria bacterium]|nr:SRPBCC domain-containing protein [Candidatus Limnocylindria bacterium]